MTPRSHFSGISVEKVKRQMERERKWALGWVGGTGVMTHCTLATLASGKAACERGEAHMMWTSWLRAV